MGVLQANLADSKWPSIVLTKAMVEFDISLIQEIWVYRTSKTPRTCIIIRKGINVLQPSYFKDLTVVKWKLREDSRKSYLYRIPYETKGSKRCNIRCYSCNYVGKWNVFEVN